MNQSQFDQLVERICSVKVTDPQTPLVDLGVDSLHTIALVMAVEEEFGIEVDPDALADPALASPAGLLQYVQTRAAAPAPAGI
ncbi:MULTISPECIES: acyl carrier protein [Streptomycetaceae]|uniref:acyl carrier protein n=1 Tax=Streptomycetaceae TaxID=2062 RepID=UPI000CDC05FE|nr:MULTISPECIES: acyl carrier protein [Streptomycetaceae]AUY50623.1 acyl carrier protein [Streptomyces sp. CB01881]MBP0455394.1 acyl carrier protein [Kitasatospora sp. RG8]TYC74009.1 acyl carrier protein [Streptomyces sp. CB01881]